MKLRHGILTGLMLLGLGAAPAMAADPKWTGCYVGANLGYAMQTSRAVDDQGPAWAQFDLTAAADGVTYGVGAGCDYQTGNFVLGVMGSYDWTNAKDQVEIPIGGGTLVGDMDVQSMWFIGGRVGYLMTPNVLGYALGGYTKVNLDPLAGANDSIGDPGGLTVGGGLEVMLPGNWTGRIEYRFTDLGNDTLQWAAAPTAVADVDTNLHQVRLGLTYRFGSLVDIK